MADFSWNNPYPSVRVPLFARNVVSTSHPLAAQAGLRMLLKGGNAVDAAIAAAAALFVVEPVSCGIGGDAFALVWDGDQLHGLNASGPAPAAWTPEYFEKKHDGKIPVHGWDSVTVPGAVAAWVELAERYGRLPFADLFEPAIELAERGFMVPPVVQHKWAAAIPHLKTQPGFKRVFMPRGRAPDLALGRGQPPHDEDDGGRPAGRRLPYRTREADQQKACGRLRALHAAQWWHRVPDRRR